MIYWILVTYVIGSAVGWYLGQRHGLKAGVGITVDSLVDGGYLRSKLNSRGETVILKFKDDEV